MADHRFGILPACVSKPPNKFEFRIPNQQRETFVGQLQISSVGPQTWYNKQEDLQFGISRRWLTDAIETWLKFDFDKLEDNINSLPNFKASIEDPDRGLLSIHFAALFSQRKDAIPVIFMHGWPSSFLEFWPMLRLLAEKYTPETLPYHAIVPSLPGYGFSSCGNLASEFTLDQAPRSMQQLMVDLGFGEGYVAQGGDIGSNLAEQMSAKFDGCKAYHLNFLFLEPAEDITGAEGPTAVEREQLERGKKFGSTGNAYGLEHGFRPATIGLCISSSPLAPLACIYPYRPLASVLASSRVLSISKSKTKPLGYAAYPYENLLLPKAWAEEVYPNLVHYSRPAKGGHFAALEQPEIFLEDVIKFLKKVQNKAV